MQRLFSTRTFVLILLVLYLLHQDFWFWRDSSNVLGLPVGLTYHILYCIVCTIVFALAVRFLWPRSAAPTRQIDHS